VTGRVQGVGFRWSAVREARRLGLRGWVRNDDDGSVEVEAEGPPPQLDAFLAWLHHGPPGAFVSGVHTRPVPPGSVRGEFDIDF
jgi:acylphosphatase